MIEINLYLFIAILLLPSVALLLGAGTGFWMGRKSKDPVPSYQEKTERQVLKKKAPPESSEAFNTEDIFSEAVNNGIEPDNSKRRQTL